LNVRNASVFLIQCTLCIPSNSCNMYKIVSYTAPTDWSSLTKTKLTVLSVRYDLKLYTIQIRFYLHRINTVVHIL